MKALFTSHSITRRLQFGVGLAAGLVLGFTVWFNYRTSRAELEQQTNAKALSEIRSAARRLDDFISRIGMLPRATACRQQIYGREPDPAMVPFMAQLLSEMPEDEVYGLAMAFEDKNWHEKDAMPWVDRKSWPNRAELGYDFHDPKQEWYSAAKKSRTILVSEPYFDEGGSEITMVTYAVPMFDGASHFFGVATADLALDRIRNMVRSARLRGAAESGRVGAHEYAYLISRAGKVIVHPDEKLMLRQGFPGADLSTIPGGRFIAARPEGSATTKIKGEVRRLYWATSTLAGWRIVLNLSEDEIRIPVRALMLRSALGGLFGLLILLVTVSLISRRIANPLMDLTDTAASIEQGHFREDMLGELPLRRDEIGKLSRNFQSMIREIRSREQSLAELNQNLERTVQTRTSELAYRLAFQQALLESIPYPMFVKDANARYLGCNKAYERVFGTTSAFLTGKCVLDLDYIPEAERRRFHEEDLAVIQAASHRSYELPIQYADGEMHITLYSVDGLKLTSDAPGGLIGLLVDISDQKRIAEQLNEAKGKAEEATQMKSMFLANMSHEIRTPMNAIIGLSHLAMKTDLTPKQRDYISKVHNAGTSLLALINDILDFSKIEAGKIDVEITDFKLDEVITSVTTLTAQKAHEKGLEFLAHTAQGIPEYLIGDPLRLGQILTNFVNNAVKFTEKGEVRLEIEQLERAGEKVQLKFSVRDSGMGMTKEQCGKLFQPFTQADMSTTRKYGGTGLGLTISRRLVELMGGQIGLESEPGVGSTFSFTVWVGVGSPSASEKIIPEKLASLRVLVVDDNPSAREILQEPLSDLASRVDAVSSGKEAIAAIQLHDSSDPYDIVFMDWRMPGMDGLQTSRYIKSDETLKQCPAIVLVTAFGREEVRDESERLELDGYLVKPVTRSMIVDTLINVFSCDGEEIAAATERGQTARLLGSRILLVEDNEINQQIAVELLEGTGAKVTVANNGREAVDILSNGPQPPLFDIVLMDLQMPEMDGYQATARLRADSRFSALPIVAMTAHATIEERQRCLTSGMDDHVSKPIDPNNLFETVTRFYKPAQAPLPDTEASDASPLVKASTPPTPELPSIAGLDIQDGLSRIAGNRTLYLKLLRQFIVQQGTSLTYVATALSNNDPLLAERLAHTLKGVAGNIGAKELHASAGALERAIRERALPSSIDIARQQAAAVLDPLLAAMRTVLDSIAPASVVQIDTAPAANAAEALKAAKELATLLANSDPCAADFVQSHQSEMRALFTDEPRIHFEQLIESYDFGGAEAQLDAAIKNLSVT